MVGLPDGEKNFEDLYNRLDSIPACDRRTYGQTDGQTSCHGIVRAMYTRREVKIVGHKAELQSCCHTAVLAPIRRENSGASHSDFFSRKLPNVA